MLLTLICSLLFSGFIVYYLNLCPQPLFQVLFFLLFIFSIERLRKENIRAISARILIFSFLLSVAIIAGKHISITEPYSGLMTDNFITAYSLVDFAALFFLTGASAVILNNFVLWLLNYNGILSQEGDYSKAFLSRKQFLLTALFIFALWLPWLIAYWPGFCFADTLNSIEQALGLISLNNRNPVLYTLFIRFCILITGGFRTHNLTFALGLYTIVQMLFIACSLSFMICWLTSRCRVHRKWTYIFPTVFAFSPYIAADSIAMWKDPVFCAAVVVYSVLLAEFAVSETAAAARHSWKITYFIFSLLILFWRNNGFCAVLGALVFLFVFYLKKQKNDCCRPAVRHLLVFTLSALALWGIIVVPVYKLAGIGTPKEETAGMMLNQMSRVAAYDGNMSEDEAEYLNSIIPLEKYADTYRPCCVDELKWDSDFNYSALSGSQFLKTWISLMFKNPKLYLEAWELESYGFWTVNQPTIIGNTKNISFGNPLNSAEGGIYNIGDYSISFGCLSDYDFLQDLLPLDSWSVPLGLINWFIVFLCICLVLKKRRPLLLALAPQLGIALSLLFGTPIYYLPRYEESAQLLLPLYIALLLC